MHVVACDRRADARTDRRSPEVGKVRRFQPDATSWSFTRHLLTAEMLDPGTDRLIRTPIEVRIDPLTGHSSRILPDRGLMPANDFDLEAFARESRPRCPFCPERIETLTPGLPPAIHPDGRICHGEAVLFPNLHAYSSHSCVSVYSSQLHYLPLDEITERTHGRQPDHPGDLRQGRHGGRSGVSLGLDQRQPHASIGQLAVSPAPPGHRRLPAHDDAASARAVPATRFEAYLRAERRSRRALLGNTGRVEWLASFAPIAPAELRAFVEGVASPAELDRDLIEELAHGLTAHPERLCRAGIRELQPGDLRRAPGNRRLSAQSAHRLPLESQAALPVGLDVPRAPALGGRRRSFAGDDRRTNPPAIRCLSSAAPHALSDVRRFALPPPALRTGYGSRR